MNAQERANAWRKAQGLPPMTGTGKTAKARASGALRQAAANQAARAQACRDLKSARAGAGRKGK